MKPKFLFFFVFLIYIIICCNKNEDYRDKYTGNYNCNFVEILHYSNSQLDETFIDTLKNLEDTIIIVKKSSIFNEISFLGWNWQITTNGNIDTAYCKNSTNCIDIEYYDCEFINNSMKLYGYNESLTRFHEYHIYGNK